MIKKDFLLQKGFTFDSFPALPCPTCKVGILLLDKQKLLKGYPFESLQYIEAGGEDHGVKSLYTSVLICNNPNCQDEVVCSGEATLNLVGYSKDEYNYDFKYDMLPTEIYEDYLQFRYFNPTIEIIDIPDQVPIKFRNEILSSFALFWIDKEACANKLRRSIEVLMDYFEVEKDDIDKDGKPYTLSLHKRITRFKEKKARNYLLAIKWIGNDGSHANQSKEVSAEDIINAYELLEHTIEKLFIKKDEVLTKIAIEINKRKR